MRINKLKPVFHKLISHFERKRPKVKPYTLLSKQTNLPLDSLEITAERIGTQNAVTADKIIIGKTDNHEQQKIITTFRDKKGKIVERIFEYHGFELPEIHRVYTELTSLIKKNITGRLIQTFENLNKSGKPKIWAKISSEKQFVHTDYFTDKKDYVTISRVTTSERNIKPPVEEFHSITEYPVPSAHFCILPPEKSLAFKTKKDSSGIPQITEIISSQNINIPKNDEYLALRMYDADDVKKPITNIALKKANLEDLNIRIEDFYTTNKNIKGSFNHEAGVIKFNFKYQPKDSIIDTAFHEVKHAKQYELMGRTKKLKTRYTTNCLVKHGEENSDKAVRKADLYYDAHKNYVSSDVNYNHYRANLLEQEAWEAGERAIRDYLSKGTSLRKQFSGIMPEEL